MAKPAPTALDNVVSLAKRRGFVYPCGEIYGGTRSAWDYGPLGVELKENIKRQWWSSWSAARRRGRPRLQRHPAAPGRGRPRGHLDDLQRPADRVPVVPQALPRGPPPGGRSPTKKGIDDPDTVDLNESWPAPTAAPAARGPSRASSTDAQDLPRRHRGRVRPALPAPRDRAGHLPQLRQRGDLEPRRSRRSASPRSASRSATRSRPATSSSAPASSSRWRWSSSSSPARTRSGTSTGSTSAPAGTSTSASTPTTCATTSTRRRSCRHYSKRTVDIEYRFGFAGSEWGELEGIANRTDFDLKQHSEFSGQDLSYFDQADDERYLPYVIEPAAGLTRSLMAFLIDAYTEDEAPNTKGGVDKRVVLKLDPRLAPVKVAVLPLSPQRRPVAEGARTSPPSCGRTGTSTSTTPVRSAVATAARTRSVRRSASRSTSRPSTTTRSPSASATRWRRSGSASTGSPGYFAERLDRLLRPRRATMAPCSRSVVVAVRPARRC